MGYSRELAKYADAVTREKEDTEILPNDPQDVYIPKRRYTEVTGKEPPWTWSRGMDHWVVSFGDLLPEFRAEFRKPK